MKRFSWVRILLTEGDSVCDVAGVGYRLPVVRRIPLHTATALAASGVPTIVRRVSALESAKD